MSHIPISPNIGNMESRENDKDWLVVRCSATESVNVSLDTKKGFTAFRYLKLGWGMNPEEEIPIPVIIMDTRNAKQLRIEVFSELNFLIISEITTKTVGKRRIIPA